MSAKCIATVVASLLASIGSGPARAGDWPAWRGPSANGVTDETDLPLRFGPNENVRWKIALPAPGNSTPIVHGDSVFLTQAEDGGRKRSTMAIDRASGELVWTKSVAYEAEEPTHETNPYCSASPVTDGTRVIVSYGSAGLRCYGVDGTELWAKDLGTFRHIWGNAASPVIWKGTCLVNCGPGARTFLIALDKSDGEERWRVDIPGGKESGNSDTWTGSWSDPVLYAEDGADRLLISYPHRLISIDPADGTSVWTCDGLGNLVYTSPLVANGVAVAMSGFSGPPIAVRVGGRGDVTATHRLWREERAQQRIGSGIIHDGHVYIVNDPGVAECIELESGRVVWKERVSGRNWSSLVRSEDRLFTLDHDGRMVVFRASPKFEKIAESTTGELTRASLAVSNGDLFIRTYGHLWCIARPTSPEDGAGQ